MPNNLLHVEEYFFIAEMFTTTPEGSVCKHGDEWEVFSGETCNSESHTCKGVVVYRETEIFYGKANLHNKHITEA